jgi:acyl carrier protein
VSTMENEVLNVLSIVSGRPCAELRREQKLSADLGIDSIRAVQVLVELEARLNLNVSHDSADDFSSVDDVLIYATDHYHKPKCRPRVS